MEDEQVINLTALFIEFLKAFAKATDEERNEFLGFIKPQERRDLLALAEALREKLVESEE